MTLRHILHTVLAAVLVLDLDAPASAADGSTVAGSSATPKPFLLDPSKDPRLTEGVNLFLKKQYIEACDKLLPVVEQSPMDNTARGCYAMALSGAGRNVEARRQLSAVINWMPGLVEGYTIRALCAARMGCARQARHDLEMARRLDPGDSFKARAAIEPQVIDLLKDLPAEPPAALHAALLKAASDGESMERLVERAARLLEASNADRKHGDEVYSEERRKLQWALVGDPRNPDRLAALGTFLIDEIEARGDWVEPSRHTIHYRLQEKAHQDADNALAQKSFTAALGINPSHVPSLCGLARIEYRRYMFANAELYLRRALAAGTADREVLWLMRDILRVAATQQVVRAISLRWTRRWEEKIGNTVYEYSEIPTMEDLRQADAADANAASFLAQSREYLRRAIRNLSNDAASHDFVGCVAFRFKDYQVARKAWEKAVGLGPGKREYRYSLANAYSELDMVDQYLEQTSIGRNMEHTTASTELRWAWRHINAGNGGDAAALLARAVKVDPGDPRAIAYLACLAETKQEPAEASALYRAALALDESRARQDGCSWLTGGGRWFVNDIGRAIELRSRIAEAIEPADPRAAADLYLANARLETMTGDHALKELAHSAMMPLHGIGDRQGQEVPRFGELMRTNRALGAAALVRLKQYQAAAEHFRALPGYNGRVRNAKGKAYDVLRDEVWTSPAVTSAAIECFQSLGDQQSVQYWQVQASRAQGDAGKRHSPTGPKPSGKALR